MGGGHFRNYDGENFDFNMGNCSYVLSQVCDEEGSEPVVALQKRKAAPEVHGVNVSLDMEHLGKVKIDGALWSLPVQLDHVKIHILACSLELLSTLGTLSVSECTFACQGAGAEVKPWRSEKCSLMP
ncbi:unnamed protein product [Pleuronectes platessa]|uniref:VWFD domain-containing protein n=1 Tax=Pleuronectes platessa TaxID=8262 RepID=A0A9N7TPJ3_PLEPL|nr:unnamed protein product [Pleuronectes platessa]